MSQLVDALSRFTDAEQWLIVAFVTLMVVVFTCWVGFAVVLVTRTVLSAARFDTRKIRGLAGRAAMRLPAWRRSSPAERYRALPSDYYASEDVLDRLNAIEHDTDEPATRAELLKIAHGF